MEGGSNTTGGWRIGSRTQRAGRPQAGGRDVKIGLSGNTGLRGSTEITSCSGTNLEAEEFIPML